MRKLVHATSLARSRARSSTIVNPKCWSSSIQVASTAHSENPREKSPVHDEYCLETGYSLFAKRPSRLFPPPFLSLPSHSSDALSTHDRSRNGHPSVDGENLKGLTNGDDAILAGEHYIGVNDGVGAWSTRPKGHAA